MEQKAEYQTKVAPLQDYLECPSAQACDVLAAEVARLRQRLADYEKAERQHADGDEWVYYGELDCGCVVAAVIDSPYHRRVVKHCLEEFVDAGYTIWRTTIEEFCKAGFEKCEVHNGNFS